MGKAAFFIISTMITGSSAIPFFDVQVTLDLSAEPKVTVRNLSNGSQAGCKFAFELYSPVGLPIHVGDLATPDLTGPWTTFTFTESLPVSLGSLEIGAYSLIAKVQTPENTTSTVTKLIQTARPYGNRSGSNHNYGEGKLYFDIKCHTGQIFAEDRSNTYYLGKQGVLISRKITLSPPPDSTDTQVAPETIEGYKSVNFKIPFNADGFTLYLAIVMQYDLGDGVIVKVKYIARHCFAIACNIDLCKVSKAVEGLESKFECEPTREIEQKLILINSKLSRAIIGKLQPGCGIDVMKLLKQIIEIGEFGNQCLADTSTGIGSPANNCGCDACTIIASLADKAPASGNYSLKINKESSSVCGKVSLVPATGGSTSCVRVTGIQGIISPQ